MKVNFKIQLSDKYLKRNENTWLAEIPYLSLHPLMKIKMTFPFANCNELHSHAVLIIN